MNHACEQGQIKAMDGWLIAVLIRGEEVKTIDSLVVFPGFLLLESLTCVFYTVGQKRTVEVFKTYILHNNVA